MLGFLRIAQYGLAASILSASALANDLQPSWKLISGASQTAIVTIRVAHDMAKVCGISVDRLKYVKIHEKALRAAGSPPEAITNFRRAYEEAVEVGKLVDKEPVADPSRCPPADKRQIVHILKEMEAGNLAWF